MLAYLLQARLRQPRPVKTPDSICAPRNIYVNYIYEYDIHNQEFNSALQDPESDIVHNLASDIMDWTSEELYKRNLLSYIKDKVYLKKIVDVTTQYNNRPTIRFYVSINLNKNFIPVMRSIFELVFNRLQKERFTTSKKNIDTGNMVIIPIRK